MPLNTIGIVGAGLVGSAAAELAAIAGLDVIIGDIDGAAIARAIGSMASGLDRLVAEGTMGVVERDAAFARVTSALIYEPLGRADIVIEAVPENLALKLRVLRELDGILRSDAIVASTTSSLSISKLAATLSRPERFVGMHFFPPVRMVATVEIMRGLQTSDATRDSVEELAVRLGKTPITVQSISGSVIVRILSVMVNEAFFVLAEGHTAPSEIDEGMKLGCNHRIVPFALADFVGLDLVLSVIQNIHYELGDSKYRPAPLLNEIVAAGYLGQKTGRGVYRY